MGEESESKKLRGYILVGAVLLIGCMVALFVAPRHVLVKFGIGHGHRKTEGLVMATSLATAVENFYGEYNRLPEVGRRRFQTNDPAGLKLLEMLMPLENSSLEVQSPRRITFLQCKEARAGKGGIVFGSKQNIEGLFDPYGRPFTMILNSKYQDTLDFEYAGQQVRLRGRQVAVWSVGRDGIEGTKDDVKSWN